MRKDRRRRFLLASGALLAAPLATIAQPAQTVRRIGFLSFNPSPPEGSRRRLVEALQPLGYELGKNLIVERRFAETKAERLPALAKELVRLNLEVIVTAGSMSAHEAAKRATNSIPIVMFGTFFPVEHRLVKSLRRPGGNVTGTSLWDTMETADKLFQMLKDAVPSAKRVTVLWDPTYPENKLWNAERLREQDRKVAGIGLTLTRVEMTRPEDLSAALDRVVASRPDVFHVAANPALFSGMREIIAFTIKRKLVTNVTWPYWVEQGFLFSYSPDFSEQWERTASLVDRILRGAKPGDLPIELATKWELVLNTKTARAIGFEPPPSFMLRVTREVE